MKQTGPGKVHEANKNLEKAPRVYKGRCTQEKEYCWNNAYHRTESCRQFCTKQRDGKVTTALGARPQRSLL